MGMGKKYLVKWEIVQFANSPLEAIKKAIEEMPVPTNDDTLETVFDVEEIGENGKVLNKVRIDILMEDFEEDF
jgi:hypothetical protein